MEKTFLVQRLRKPLGRINPFAFGGGCSGLSKEAESLIAKVWSWDYMGAAEYESGEAAKALIDIADYMNTDNKTTSEIIIAKNPIYYLCRKEQKKEVTDRIRELYEKGINYRLKEPAYFREHIDGEDYAKDIVGWLELNNHFMFFADKEMYTKSMDLFVND